MNLLNCTATNCSIVETSEIINLTLFKLTILTLIVSGFGILSNSMALFILVFSRNMNSKFFHFLKIFTINSMLACLNIFIMIFGLFTLKDGYYWYNIYVKESRMNTIHTHFFLPFWILTFTFDNVLEISILYERIQMLNLKLTFLRKVSMFFLIVIISKAI